MTKAKIKTNRRLVRRIDAIVVGCGGGGGGLCGWVWVEVGRVLSMVVYVKGQRRFCSDDRGRIHTVVTSLLLSERGGVVGCCVCGVGGVVAPSQRDGKLWVRRRRVCRVTAWWRGRARSGQRGSGCVNVVVCGAWLCRDGQWTHVLDRVVLLMNVCLLLGGEAPGEGRESTGRSQSAWLGGQRGPSRVYSMPPMPVLYVLQWC